MPAWHPNGRAQISATSPRAKAICDQCGFMYSLSALQLAVQYQGFTLVNLGYLVCRECFDPPNPQLRAIILPPDPAPVMNPRPESYSSEVPSYRTTQDLLNRRVTEDGQPRVTEGIPPT